MHRTFPWLAAALAGITLLLLLAQGMLAPFRADSFSSDPAWQTVSAEARSLEAELLAATALESSRFDPTMATQEIAALRQSRGTVLAGTSLADQETTTDFTTALATYTGEPHPASPSTLSTDALCGKSLQQFARDLAAQAEQLEETHPEQADRLRSAADTVRQVARSLAADKTTAR
jgi:hypothetical protein